MNKKRNATAIKTPTTGKVGKTTNVLVPSFDYDVGVVFFTYTDGCPGFEEQLWLDH